MNHPHVIIHILDPDSHELLEDFIITETLDEQISLVDIAADIRETLEMEYDVAENDPAGD